MMGCYCLVHDDGKNNLTMLTHASDCHTGQPSHNKLVMLQKSEQFIEAVDRKQTLFVLVTLEI